MKRALPAVFSSALSALLALGLVAVLSPKVAQAATTFTWTGNGDGHSWTQPQNWMPSDNTPQDGDTVTIGGEWTITGVPTISLVSLNLSGDEMIGLHGPILVGPTSTITTQVLNWSGRGRLAASLVVNGVAVLTNISAPGPTLDNSATGLGAPPVTFTNNGSVTQTGTFGLTPGPGSGAQIVNKGTWLTAGEATIVSGNCCLESTGTIDNDGTITLGGKLALDHAKFIARSSSLVNGIGTLEIRGGLADLHGPWRISGGAKLDLTSNALAAIAGTTTVAGAFQQENTSEITGTGVFAGSGQYRWIGGTILGDLTLGSLMTGIIENTDPPTQRELSSATGAGVLTVKGTVLQTADLLMNGNIVNEGTWHVTQPSTFPVIEAGALTTPPKKFQNEGAILVDSGLELTLSLIEFSNPPDLGTIKGGGTVRFLEGIHRLRDGLLILESGTKVVFEEAEVLGSGTLHMFSGTQLVVAETVMRGTFTIGGGGTALLQSGTIIGDLTTGPNLDVRLMGADASLAIDGATGAGILRTKGDVRQKTPHVVILQGDAQIVNKGTWLMEQASFAGGTCCADPATFRNEGKLTVRGSASPTAKLSFMQFVNTGSLVIHDTLEFATLSPRSPDGIIDLKTGRIVTAKPLVVSGGALHGALVGAGEIQGDLTNSGTVDPGHGSTKGEVSVSGTYKQLQSGWLALDIFGGAGCDRIHAEALVLDGKLALDNPTSVALGRNDRFIMLGVQDRIGRFDRVIGLGGLGPAWRVRYTATGVKLIHV